MQDGVIVWGKRFSLLQVFFGTFLDYRKANLLLLCGMTKGSKSRSDRKPIQRKLVGAHIDAITNTFQARFLHSNQFNKNIYYYSLPYKKKFFNGALNSDPQQEKFLNRVRKLLSQQVFEQRIDWPVIFQNTRCRHGSNLPNSLICLLFTIFFFHLYVYIDRGKCSCEIFV